VQPGQQAAALAVHAGSRRSPDSARSSRAVQGDLQDSGNPTQPEYARGDVHENCAAGLLSVRKPSLRVLRGVSQDNLPGAVGFLPFLRNLRQQPAFEQAEWILQAA
jgi:hypothetical protein